MSASLIVERITFKWFLKPSESLKAVREVVCELLTVARFWELKQRQETSAANERKNYE